MFLSSELMRNFTRKKQYNSANFPLDAFLQIHKFPSAKKKKTSYTECQATSNISKHNVKKRNKSVLLTHPVSNQKFIMEIKPWWCFEVCSRLEDRSELLCIHIILTPQCNCTAHSLCLKASPPAPLFPACILIWPESTAQLIPPPGEGTTFPNLLHQCLLLFPGYSHSPRGWTTSLAALFLKQALKSSTWPWVEIRGNLVFPMPSAVPPTDSALSKSFWNGWGQAESTHDKIGNWRGWGEPFRKKENVHKSKGTKTGAGMYKMCVRSHKWTHVTTRGSSGREGLENIMGSSGLLAEGLKAPLS